MSYGDLSPCKIGNHKNLCRVPVLLLLLLALAGPWLYTLDGVPPPEWCRDPFIMLQNGRCVGLVSFGEILAFLGNGVLAVSAGLISGALTSSENAAEFPRLFLITMLLFLLVLPIFSTLLLIAGRSSRRVQIFYLVTWGGAAAVSLLPIAVDAMLRSGRFWGIWLYLGLATGVLVLEILVLVVKRRFGISTRPNRALR